MQDSAQRGEPIDETLLLMREIGIQRLNKFGGNNPGATFEWNSEKV
jgi:hypothetical protein